MVLAKLSGRYDHDELVLRKSTLEETPSLLALAAAYALAWSPVSYLAGAHLEFGGAGVAVLWATTASCLLVARTGEPAGSALAPPERALIVGDAPSRARLTQSLSYDPAARVEVIGYLPPEDDGAQPPFAELKASGGAHVHRAFLIPRRQTERTLDPGGEPPPSGQVRSSRACSRSSARRSSSTRWAASPCPGCAAPG